MGIQGYMRIYNRIHGYIRHTWVYKGLHGYIGVYVGI